MIRLEKSHNEYVRLFEHTKSVISKMAIQKAMKKQANTTLSETVREQGGEKIVFYNKPKKSFGIKSHSLMLKAQRHLGESFT